MKKWFFLSAVGTFLLGCAWHFFYPWCPHPLVGFFAPVDESIWEHFKLLYWPVLPAAALLAYQFDTKAVWSSFLCQLLWMPLALASMYYLAAGGFGIAHGIVNIALYAIAIGWGFVRAYRTTCSRAVQPRLGELCMLVGLYGGILILFTLATPDLPIFQPPR